MDDLISRQDAINAPIKMVSEGLEWVPVYHLKELPSLKLIQEQEMWIVDGHHISCNRCGISLCRTDRGGLFLKST